MFVVKHYVAEHSYLLGTFKNKRVTAQVVPDMFGEVISSVPFIRPRHLKAIVRKELGVFVNKVPSDYPQTEASQGSNIGSNMQRRQKTVAEQASKGKKSVLAGTQGSFSIIRGAHTGGVVIGRENPYSTSFITASQLTVMALKSRRLAAHQNQYGEQSRQTSASVEAANFPTQNNTTSVATQGKR
ncbi:hypothetical protein J5N97_020581 [Dioscorea zingiberensis]|uniref:Uncharacterized protein n=1 Tax=Dioscorea zingiberensis TaxID=325984 RepID=A0A9D5CG31_9LILI|nr:hypothetical protein J5N97_020581 [Dioscorea zingiberensis]